MSIRIIVDSSSDLPKSLVDQYDFKIIPLSVHFGKEEYLDSIDITPTEFYSKLEKSDDMPSTSQIPPERFIEYITPEIEAGHEVIVITMGSNASGTCQSANIAVSELETDKVTIIDTNSLCLGVAYVAVVVAKLVAEGKTISEIVEVTKSYTDNQIEHLFCVDTLEYLKKGGRIKASKAVVAEILNIKPILNVENAITQTIHKVRGRKKIIPYYINKMSEELDFNSDMIMVAHSSDPAFADKLVAVIKDELKWDKDIFISEIGATIGSHTGPGVLACFYKKK